jgi:hypothetical protein
MFEKTSNRQEAYKNITNMLLQDNTYYCNHCGKTFDNISKEFCCENPQIGTNADVAEAVAYQCRYLRETRANDHASNKSKTLRMGLQLPVFMYEALSNYEKAHGRKLISTDKDIHFLMKIYPQFRIPRRI